MRFFALPGFSIQEEIMLKRKYDFERIVILAAAGLFLLAGCAMTPLAPRQPVENVNKILVMPFRDMAAIYGREGNIRCPLCGDVFAAGVVPDGVEGPLSEKLFHALSDGFGYELVSPDQVRERFPDLIAAEAMGRSDREMLLEIGRQLEVDAVLVGHLYRYQDRVGVAYAVDAPASVAFDMHLLQVSNGRILWTGRFDETQRALSDDALKIGTFLKGRGQWMTAGQMAALGIEGVLKSFPRK